MGDYARPVERLADLMTRDVLAVAPEDTLGEAAQKMVERHVGSAVVMDFGRLIGILTERDLMRATAGRTHSSEARVREWMTADPITVAEDTSAAAGAGVGVELIVFIAAAFASLAFLRPIARRHLHMPARLRTGTAALVGARGVAIDRIDAHGGRVKIGGETWTARAFDEAQVIEPGTRVDIVKIEGATALVYE